MVREWITIALACGHHVGDGLAEAVGPAGVALGVGLADVEHEVDPVVGAGRVDLVGLQRAAQPLRVAVGDVETDQVRGLPRLTRGSFPSPCRLGRTPRRPGPRARRPSSCHPWRLNTTGLPFLRRASQLFCAVSLTRTVKRVQSRSTQELVEPFGGETSGRRLGFRNPSHGRPPEPRRRTRRRRARRSSGMGGSFVRSME